MKKLSVLIFSLIISILSQAQPKTQNVVIVTLDGMRWQEVFKGADTRLINDTSFNHDVDGMKKEFWDQNENVRRQKLFPFFWSTIYQKGQLYGNRVFGNQVDNANPYWFSYPGYNEIFTGNPDTAVNSNDKIYNRNVNVLEFLNKQNGFQGKIAAFSSWDVFPYILNAPRSGIYVNADVDTLKFNTPAFQLINDLQFTGPRPVGVRPDLLTYFAAREYLKTYKPRVLYVAFDETDDFAHAGMYDQYLKSAQAEDKMISDLWNTLQAIPQYKDKTTLLITCDHGRGDLVKENWRHHGQNIPDSHEIWLAVIGPDVQAMGEVKQPMQLYQRQIATTIAALLGYDFKPAHPVLPPVQTIVK